ncbi:SMC-Scp complex subunit ScpB [Pisciglobus halotolerans]|uniref:Segregation and condensation protein B n=1 Tax=Pisciglobus halotolerans TaxID=745365 RepID=A0A1I3CI69_9LACT|nr:SMC-Scp complex subunit ScpB [Pisciglobus halotolerans]SFH73929.1 condensin subunit ScpB [Pisciglobus halotolerans]
MEEAAIEALLFVAGDEGLTLEEIASLLDISTQSAFAQLMSLQQMYASSKRGLMLLEAGEKYELATKKDFSEIVKKYASSPFATSLSQAALENLAIIAYKQPLTRLEIDEIRGVHSGASLQKLVLRGLIEEKGRMEAPGRPILYGTTQYFMDYFGLKTLSDLPDIKDLEQTDEEESEADLFFERFKGQFADSIEEEQEEL